VTKSELIKRIAARYKDMQQKDVKMLVELIFEDISHALAEGRRVELRGFGAFSLRKRQPRQARNPRTNEVVTLGERFAPYFRAGKELRALLNKE
tara:strand:+ start:188 stop:469 length:282 start_codon:yes stop_codon:yes gene_type:complete